jgi:hypothetical protein
MPRGSSPKRERQFEHIKDSAEQRGQSTGRAEEIAARTVNKERARSGEAETASRTSKRDISSSRRGGLRSHRGAGGPTCEPQSARARGEDVPRGGEGMSTADKDKLADQDFAFPEERKEPLTDARHVRNAIARFDQVEGVSDAERDKAWKRIVAAAKRYDVDVSESDWRELAKGGKERRR